MISDIKAGAAARIAATLWGFQPTPAAIQNGCSAISSEAECRTI